MSTEARTPPSSTLAPWAEVVPGVGLMTVDDLEALPDDEWQYELVEGVLVRMPHSGGEASQIARRLAGRLGDFVDDHALGAVTGADGGYILDPVRPKETELAPDVGFMRAEQVPPRTSAEYAKPWRGAPDLAVEVVSPAQYRPEMASKARLYLSFGTRLVWVVWPRYQQVDIWRPGDDVEPSTARGLDDTLDGEDVVRGFTYPVAKLFR